MANQTRLYSKGRIMSHQRGKRNLHPGTTLVKIEGVENTKDATFYLGKRIAYVYRGTNEVRGTRIRVIWGRVTRTHGNSGVVRTKFSSNIPAHAFGSSVRVLLYPSNSAYSLTSLKLWYMGMACVSAFSIPCHTPAAQAENDMCRWHCIRYCVQSQDPCFLPVAVLPQAPGQ